MNFAAFQTLKTVDQVAPGQYQIHWLELCEVFARTLFRPMSRPVIERRLTEVGERLQRLRTDLAVAEEQLAHLTADAEDARVRSLVSETAQSGSVHRDAERHARAMERHRDDVLDDIARLEATQDELLDRMGADD
jgi:chromosome segregation ATPase